PATVPTLSLPAGVRRATVGRLRVGANWDPEPGAWRRLGIILTNDHRLWVDVVPVDAADAQLKGVPLVHWTGTGAVKLTPAQRAALKAYVAGGGTLVVDAAGGDRAFADAAEAELAATFGTKPGEVGMVLAADDPVYRLAGARIDRFEYRPYLIARGVGKLNAPRVRGIERAGRTGVFFSRDDLTAGCVGQPTDGILGYAPATATAILRNITLTATKNSRQ
ncbi:MAG: hypothetical protein JWO31_2227, partial [Phycisphaerales bacterium]|nr:hypothetical protein [Phycisphaerales bacterium]